MASIMMTAMPFAGHARPVRAVAAELVRRGHDVRVSTGRSYTGMFDDVGARGMPWRAAPDFDERDLAATFPAMRGRKGFAQVVTNLRVLFLGTAPAQCADLLALAHEEPWDLLAGDPMALGTRFAAERLATEGDGAPWASVSPIPYWPPGPGIPPTGLGLRPATGPFGRVRDTLLGGATRAADAALARPYQRVRREAGLGPGPGRETFDSMWYSPRLVVAAGSLGLDYPRADIGEHVRFVGDLTDDGAESGAALPAWWSDVVHADVPVVHVTQGTANVDPHDLILPTLEALADAPVLVVVGLGHRTDPLPGPLPANVRVAQMVPYGTLLPRTAAMVTNGGYGGVLQALRHDVPLVVAGGDLDKPEIAARIGWSGAGVDLRTGTPRPTAVRRAVREVLREPGYREAATRLGAELRALGGARAAADALEMLLAGGVTDGAPSAR